MSRNAVLITVDSLRADHCGFLADEGPGSTHNLTPALDSLAEESMIFERAFAPGPRTPSSLPAIFTGEFYRPAELGVYSNWEEKATGWQARRQRIGNHLARFPPIAEHMRRRGYETAGVTANPWTTETTNFHRGFDEFYAISGAEHSEKPWYSLLADQFGDAVGIDWQDVLLTWTDFYDMIRAARESLTEPYFLWVFLMDPHQPYIAPRRYREENTALGMLYGNGRFNYAHGYTENLPKHLDARLRRAYRDTVRSVDGFVERYRADFAADDPVTLFHADHGEAFQEHGTLGHRPQLYNENVHVPLLIHGMDVTGRSKPPVTLRRLPDIVASVVDDRTSPLEAFTCDFALSKTEEGERIGVRGASWAYHTSADDWAYIHDGDHEELYRLVTDPDEQANVADQHLEITTMMRRLIDRHEFEQIERDRITSAVAGIMEDQS